MTSPVVRPLPIFIEPVVTLPPIANASDTPLTVAVDIMVDPSVPDDGTKVKLALTLFALSPVVDVVTKVGKQLEEVVVSAVVLGNQMAVSFEQIFL